jgi:hypothetical protein
VILYKSASLQRKPADFGVEIYSCECLPTLSLITTTAGDNFIPLENRHPTFRSLAVFGVEKSSCEPISTLSLVLNPGPESLS